MDCESIDHEAVGQMGYSNSKSMRAERTNCFSINLMIGQKQDVQIKLTMKFIDDIIAKQGLLLFLSAIFSLLVGYHK